MYVASRTAGRRLGSPLCPIVSMALMILATLGANPCMAQGFGHGMPAPPPAMPHFTPAPSMPRYTHPPVAFRPSSRPLQSFGGPSQAPMRRSVQNGITQGLGNDITQQQLLRNQMDTLRQTRDRLNQDRLNRESQRRIQDQINSQWRSLGTMKQTRDHEQTRREEQAQIDRAQSQIGRLPESRLAGGVNPGASEFEEGGRPTPSRRRRARPRPEEPKVGQAPPAELVDSGAQADQRLRMARGIEQAGNFPGALAYYQQVVDKHPGTSQANLAEQNIAELKQRIKYRKFLGLE
jgi:hypothetical protein